MIRKETTTILLKVRLFLPIFHPFIYNGKMIGEEDVANNRKLSEYIAEYYVLAKRQKIPGREINKVLSGIRSISEIIRLLYSLEKQNE